MSNLIRWNSWYYLAASALLLVAVLACGTAAPQEHYEPMDITTSPTPALLSQTTTDMPTPMPAPQSDPDDNGGEGASDEESTPEPTPLPTRCVVVPSPYQEDGILREGEQITDGVKEYCSVLEPKPTPKYLALGQLTYKVQKTEEDIAEAEESEGAGGESGQSQVEIPIFYAVIFFTSNDEATAAMNYINDNTPGHDPEAGIAACCATLYAKIPVTLLVPISEMDGFSGVEDAEQWGAVDPQ